MADQWYYAKGEKKLGPFSSAEFKELADSGRLLPTDTIWKEGIDKGVPASKVKNLFSKLPTALAPAPTEQSPASESPKETAENAELHGAPSSALSAPSAVESSPDSSSAAEGKAEPEKPSTSPEAPASAATAAEAPAKKTPRPPPAADQKRHFRVTGARGAIILGVDGAFVRYKKRCPVCGTEDSSVRTLQLRSGINRDRYFCQKCRKLQHVEIHGSL